MPGTLIFYGVTILLEQLSNGRHSLISTLAVAYIVFFFKKNLKAKFSLED